MGLIAPVIRRDLHLIRKIRNDFAHSAARIDFSHDVTKARCQELVFAPQADRTNPRKTYIMGVLGLAGVIEGVSMSIDEGDTPKCTKREGPSPAIARTTLNQLAQNVQGSLTRNLIKTVLRAKMNDLCALVHSS